MPMPSELPDDDDPQPTLEEQLEVVAPVATRLMVRPRAMLAAVQAVSVARRGTVAWSNHDKEIAESCVGAFLHAVTAMTGAVDRRRHREALESILTWCEAYSPAFFQELSQEQLMAAGRALEAAGISLSSLYGPWGRHLLEGVAKLAREALEDKPG